MIPCFHGIRGPQAAPVTWVMVILNSFLFIGLLPIFTVNDRALESVLSHDGFLQTQARVYAQHVLKNPGAHPPVVQKNAPLALQGEDTATELLGMRTSLHDQRFLASANSRHWNGDRLELKDWRENFLRLTHLRLQHPMFQLGYSAASADVWQLVTYQFVHSGWLHFLLNMFFLFIFGVAIEPRLGPLRTLLIYLASGSFAAIAFSLASPDSAVPLVGASGAIGGLIGATLVCYWGQRAKFFFYFGFADIPVVVWVFYFWILVDVSGWLKALPGFSTQVAHSAHLGGTLMGVILAVFMTRIRPAQPVPELKTT